MDFLGETLRLLMDAIMDAEASARIGAEYGERNPDRLTYPQRVPLPLDRIRPIRRACRSRHRTSRPEEPASHTVSRTAVAGTPVPTRGGRGPSSKGISSITLSRSGRNGSGPYRLGPTVPEEAQRTRIRGNTPGR